jgi:hypothetical protein
MNPFTERVHYISFVPRVNPLGRVFLASILLFSRLAESSKDVHKGAHASLCSRHRLVVWLRLERMAGRLMTEDESTCVQNRNVVANPETDQGTKDGRETPIAGPTSTTAQEEDNAR